MSNTSQEQYLALLRLLANSKVISELTEITSVTTDSNYLVLNSGVSDAQKIKIPLLRGFIGDYNATTNSPSLSNGTGLKGDTYNVSVAGTRDFGNGAISFILDDLVFYNGAKWIKSTKSEISDIQGLQAALDSTDANDVVIDDAALVVVPVTDLQLFANGVDAALLRARGTGVSTSYVSTVSVGGTTFAQPDVSGEINSDQGYFSISHTGATGISVNDLTASSTYVYIDNAGNRQQQTTTPTRQDWSRKMFTMRIGVNTVTNTIIGFEYLNNPIGHYANSIRDLYEYLLKQGIPFKSDQVITGRAGDLGFDVSAGTIMEFGGTGDINNANIKPFDQADNVSYNLMSRTALVSSETDLVKFWDNAGTITALGSTTLVGHRLYRFSSGNFAMQYGQGNYANMTLAKAGVLTEEYVLNPALKDATFFGWWLIESTATNTGGTTLTDFIEYTIGVQGGSSSSLSGALLKGNNLSDLLDTAAAKTTLLDYKSYVSVINQTGSSAPTEDYVLENTIGSLVYTYISAGLYNVALTGAFSANKTLVFTTNNYTGRPVKWERLDDDNIKLSTGFGDSTITNCSIEIRVYN
jgi:hypothetical protein